MRFRPVSLNRRVHDVLESISFLGLAGFLWFVWPAAWPSSPPRNAPIQPADPGPERPYLTFLGDADLVRYLKTATELPSFDERSDSPPDRLLDKERLAHRIQEIRPFDFGKDTAPPHPRAVHADPGERYLSAIFRPTPFRPLPPPSPASLRPSVEPQRWHIDAPEGLVLDRIALKALCESASDSGEFTADLLLDSDGTVRGIVFPADRRALPPALLPDIDRLLQRATAPASTGGWLRVTCRWRQPPVSPPLPNPD